MDERRDFEIVRIQADIIQLQKQIKRLNMEHDAISKILVEKVKPICDAYYHEIEHQEDGIGYV